MQQIPVPQDSFAAQRVIGRIAAQAMLDDDFKTMLVSNPSSILAEHGLDLPEDVHVEILSSADKIPQVRAENTVYLVIPEAQALGYEELTIAKYAAGSCQSTASTACTSPSCVSSASTASTQC